jgi:hypothetical protein
MREDVTLTSPGPMTSVVECTTPRVLWRPCERSACRVFERLAPTPKRYFDEVIVWCHSCQMAQPMYNLTLCILNLIGPAFWQAWFPVFIGWLLGNIGCRWLFAALGGLKKGCCDTFYVSVVPIAGPVTSPPVFLSVSHIYMNTESP